MLLIKRYCYNFHNINTIIKNNDKNAIVKVQGWIQNVRRLKKHIFLDVNDGSTIQKFQIVLDRNDQTKLLSTGDVIRAMGHIRIAPHGHFELHAEQVESIAEGHLNEGYPFTPKQDHPMDYVRGFLHLRSRFNQTAAIIRLRHRVQKILHDVMDENNFIHINTPILTTNDCEGAGEVFTVQPDSKSLMQQMARPNVPLTESYFDSKVYLSVSGQLHLEAMSYGLGNTYTLSPAFRAENCKSPLHLAEFYMFEAELVYMETINQLCSFIEKIIKEITNRLLNSNDVDIKYCQKQIAEENHDFGWLDLSWPLITYKDAKDIIVKNQDKFKTDVVLSRGFSKEQELYLVEYFKAPLFIIDWPTVQKPFYMRVSRGDPNVVHALDLIMPTVGELCGGSLREYDEAYLIKHEKLPPNLKWYLELRKFGGIPTGGFGMGFERYLQLLTGVKNIRDVIPFPRYPHSCKM